MISCSIDLSNKCQNKCRFCLSDGYLDGSFFDVDLYEAVLIKLKDHNYHLNSIVFSGGGEPLLHPQFDVFVETTQKHGLKLGMITNGINLDRWIDVIPSFTFVKVSLDAGSKETYKKIKGTDLFNIVTENIHSIYGKTFVTIGYILQRENSGELFDLQEWLPADAWSIRQNVYKHRRRPTLESCSKAKQLGIITTTGDVFYCSVKRWNSDYRLGNIHTDDYRSIFNETTFDHTKCSDCRYTNGTKHEGFI